MQLRTGWWVLATFVLMVLGVTSSGTSAAAFKPQTSPVSGFVSITAGSGHTCGLTPSGGVKCWGVNYVGQLGDGTRTDRYTPVYVSGLTHGVVAVSAGSTHTCALLTTGGVKCWGNNNRGQLGNGTKVDRSTPVDVVGLTSGVAAIDAGGLDTCAITLDGAAKCWGSNNAGRLGDGTTTDRWTPVDVVGLSSGVIAIRTNDVGGAHTCAIVAGGGAKCWGNNQSGQLGDGSGLNQYTPVDVAGLSSGVSDMSLGTFSSCAALTAGGVKCWGSNSVGQLGDGTTTDQPTPVAVSGPIGVVQRLTAGGSHACVLLDTGPQCWGYNFSGQLGDGTTTDRHTPVAVLGLAGAARSLSAGGAHTCVTLDSGLAQCWGDNVAGQLGNGAAINFTTATAHPTLTVGVTGVGLGSYHACALASGGVQCWGDNGFGQLGAGPIVTHTPVGVSGLSAGVSALAAGPLHTCAIQNGGVQCWGDNRFGQLGDGTTTNHATPISVTGLISGVLAVSSGYHQTCAVTEAGGVYCWGDGAIGACDVTSALEPVPVCGLNSGVTAISVGSTHACALLATGNLMCWGNNASGQLGDGTTTGRSTPVDVIGLTQPATAVAAGLVHTCATLLDGTVQCWGNNAYGQLSDGTATGLTALNAGDGHTCAITSGGGVQCWGYNFYGQLGDGTLDNRAAPRPVIGLSSGVTAIEAGYEHTCAVASGGLWCWGNNEHGLVSPDQITYAAWPVTVLNAEWRAHLPVLLHNYVPLHVSFTADPLTGLSPLNVTFTNTSTGTDLISEWDFGDGYTSTLASPSHIYTTAGVYTATLRVHGSGEVGEATMLITVSSGMELIYNGGFEEGLYAWLWDGVPEFADVITDVAHSGTRSSVFGIVPPDPLVYGYGSARYMITIPCAASPARLSFWYWPRREGLAGDPARSRQFAYVRDGSGVLQTLFVLADDLPGWQYAEYDLANFRCRTIEIQFGVYHDGNLVYGKRAWLYVDDVSLVVPGP